jgi:hypothetical protein
MSGVFQNIYPPAPPPHRPASVYPPALGAGGGHTRWVERGFNILEDARHSSVLYICKYLVDRLDNLKIKDDSAKYTRLYVRAVVYMIFLCETRRV